MRFTGFPEQAIEFYLGLEADNSKDYWQANKATYERCIVEPFRSLLDDLEPEFGAGKLFRPYRDVRFSKDKTPYKTNAGAQLTGGGYVALSADGMGVGAGYYMVEPSQVAAQRAAILDDTTGGELQTIVDDLRTTGAELMARDSVSTAPRGVPKDHERIELLRLKGLAVWWDLPAGPWMSTPEARDRIVTHLRDAAPLLTWLDTNVGRVEPSERRPRR